MKYLIGNWKMHTTVPEAVALAGRLEDAVGDAARAGKSLETVVVCPPFVALTAVRDVLDDRTLRVGAQDCHWEDAGAHTGEVSAEMLRDVAEFVLLGHSERRAAGEDNDQIAKKVAAAARAGLTPVLCVGEPNPDDVATQHAEEELRAGLTELDANSDHHLLVAYEPVWAVGSGKAAESKHVGEVVTHLRSVLAELGHGPAEVLYGGSVTRQNASEFAAVDGLDGLLVGGASLNPGEFAGIIEGVAS